MHLFSGQNICLAYCGLRWQAYKHLFKGWWVEFLRGKRKKGLHSSLQMDLINLNLNALERRIFFSIFGLSFPRVIFQLSNLKSSTKIIVHRLKPSQTYFTVYTLHIILSCWYLASCGYIKRKYYNINWVVKVTTHQLSSWIKEF